jgi:hypothetical protein
VESLESEREKLCQEEEAEQKKDAALEAKMQDLAKAFILKRCLLERIVGLHTSLAIELYNAGEGLEPPPLDADFLAALELHREALALKRLQRLEPPPLPPPVGDAQPAVEEQAVSVEELPKAFPVGEPPEAVQEQAPSVEEIPQAPPVGEPPQAVEQPLIAEGVLEKLKREFEHQKDFLQLALQTLTLDDLSPPQRVHMEHVMATGNGVCSRCRWKSGCLSCDVKKAWLYCVRIEMGVKVSGKPSAASGPRPSGGGPSVEVSILIQIILVCWLAEAFVAFADAACAAAAVAVLPLSLLLLLVLSLSLLLSLLLLLLLLVLMLLRLLLLLSVPLSLCCRYRCCCCCCCCSCCCYCCCRCRCATAVAAVAAVAVAVAETYFYNLDYFVKAMSLDPVLRSLKRSSEMQSAIVKTRRLMEGVNFKSELIEKRLMNQTLELHECIGQIKHCVKVFKQDLSNLDWMASIIVRELNTFELAERQRYGVFLSRLIAKLNVVL